MEKGKDLNHVGTLHWRGVRNEAKGISSRGPAIAPPRDKPANGALVVSGAAESTQCLAFF